MSVNVSCNNEDIDICLKKLGLVYCGIIDYVIATTSSLYHMVITRRILTIWYHAIYCHANLWFFSIFLYLLVPKIVELSDWNERQIKDQQVKLMNSISKQFLISVPIRNPIPCDMYA